MNLNKSHYITWPLAYTHNWKSGKIAQWNSKNNTDFVLFPQGTLDLNDRWKLWFLQDCKFSSTISDSLNGSLLYFTYCISVLILNTKTFSDDWLLNVSSVSVAFHIMDTYSTNIAIYCEECKKIVCCGEYS